MEATPLQFVTTDTNSMFFDFVDGGNITSKKDTHMHSLKVTWIDKDHFMQEWSAQKDGKKQNGEVFRYARVM